MRKQEKLLTVTDLSEYLKVPVGTIYYWVSARKIPYTKFGKHIRFELETVLSHFRSQSRNEVHKTVK